MLMRTEKRRYTDNPTTRGESDRERDARLHNTNTDRFYLYECLFDFIVMRCYRKLYARLESGARLWTCHPLTALTAISKNSVPSSPSLCVLGSRQTPAKPRRVDIRLSSPIVFVPLASHIYVSDPAM